MKVAVTVILVLSFCLTFADRTIWYVHPDSTLNSIQVALDSCADNDIVLVGPGVYHPNGIFWPNKQGIHLISELGPDTTIIDGGYPFGVLVIDKPVDTTTVIRGFTMRNGYGHIGWYGGGITCDSAASPVITGNIITDNSGDYSGGGINCTNNTSPIISNNIIKDNYSEGMAAAINCEYGSSPKIINNTITNNWSNHSCGGIKCFGSTTIIGNTINNNAYDGIRCYGTTNTTITGNTITNNGFKGILCWGGSMSIINNKISGHITGIWCRYSTSFDSIVIIGDTIINNSVYGIRCEGSSPIIDSCVISDNGVGIYCDRDTVNNMPPQPVIHFCNIALNTNFGVQNIDTNVIVDAEYNWWGDSTGPYHPDSNPGGQGDSVSDYVDFIPWLDQAVGVAEQKITIQVNNSKCSATIFSGPLLLPEGKDCRVFDITGRVVLPDKIKPGIYFIEIDGKITKKVIKVR